MKLWTKNNEISFLLLLILLPANRTIVKWFCETEGLQNYSHVEKKVQKERNSHMDNEQVQHYLENQN